MVQALEEGKTLLWCGLTIAVQCRTQHWRLLWTDRILSRRYVVTNIWRLVVWVIEPIRRMMQRRCVIGSISRLMDRCVADSIWSLMRTRWLAGAICTWRLMVRVVGPVCRLMDRCAVGSIWSLMRRRWLAGATCTWRLTARVMSPVCRLMDRCAVGSI